MEAETKKDTETGWGRRQSLKQTGKETRTQPQTEVETEIDTHTAAARRETLARHSSKTSSHDKPTTDPRMTHDTSVSLFIAPVICTWHAHKHKHKHKLDDTFTFATW